MSKTILDNAENASQFLKTLANKHRLVILCQLIEGEKTVSELIDFSGAAQATISQHLSKLKDEGIVDFRRDHRHLYYRIVNEDVAKILHPLHSIFCPPEKS